MLKLNIKITASIILIVMTISSFAQKDATWNKAVQKWESSKNLKASYCKKGIVASAKGYSSDYNTEGAEFEGDIVYDNNGFFKINTVRFVNKGEEHLVEGGKLSKDSFPDMMHTREHLVFAKENQKYLTVKKLDSKADKLVKYKVSAKIPDYDEFSVTVSINIHTGNPVKVINAKSASGEAAKAEAKVTITYKDVNGNLVVESRLEEAKVSFFGNASYMSYLYTFSKYN